MGAPSARGEVAGGGGGGGVPALAPPPSPPLPPPPPPPAPPAPPGNGLRESHVAEQTPEEQVMAATCVHLRRQNWGYERRTIPRTVMLPLTELSERVRAINPPWITDTCEGSLDYVKDSWIVALRSCGVLALSPADAGAAYQAYLAHAPQPVTIFDVSYGATCDVSAYAPPGTSDAAPYDAAAADRMLSYFSDAELGARRVREGQRCVKILSTPASVPPCTAPPSMHGVRGGDQLIYEAETGGFATIWVLDGEPLTFFGGRAHVIPTVLTVANVDDIRNRSVALIVLSGWVMMGPVRQEAHRLRLTAIPPFVLGGGVEAAVDAAAMTQAQRAAMVIARMSAMNNGRPPAVRRVLVGPAVPARPPVAAAAAAAIPVGPAAVGSLPFEGRRWMEQPEPVRAAAKAVWLAREATAAARRAGYACATESGGALAGTGGAVSARRRPREPVEDDIVDVEETANAGARRRVAVGRSHAHSREESARGGWGRGRARGGHRSARGRGRGHSDGSASADDGDEGVGGRSKRIHRGGGAQTGDVHGTGDQTGAARSVSTPVSVPVSVPAAAPLFTSVAAPPTYAVIALQGQVPYGGGSVMLGPPYSGVSGALVEQSTPAPAPAPAPLASAWPTRPRPSGPACQVPTCTPTTPCVTHAWWLHG